MKIVITAGGIIWNESHPALQKYGSDVVIVRRAPDAAAELVARVGMDRNVLVLTDNDPRSFMPFQVLAGQFRSRRIHLFACLPFSYESTRRKRELFELLGDMSSVWSLCLVELDDFLNGSKADETLGSLQLRIRNDMIFLIDQAVNAMQGLDAFSRYRYDLKECVYRKDDFSTFGSELEEKLLTKKRPVRTVAEPEEDRPEPEAAEETGLREDAAQAAIGSGPADSRETATVNNPENSKEGPTRDIAANTVPDTEDIVSNAPVKAEEKKRRSLFAFFRKRKD